MNCLRLFDETFYDFLVNSIIVWAWWPTGFSDMLKPQLLDHAHVDALAEGWDMLLDVDHKS